VSSSPEITVVMAVYDGAALLQATIDSVLSQDADFELVCVDDGSNDGSAQLLASAAEGDSRVRVLHQAHRGLTAALVRGCAAARGDFIARQDVGDLSLPGRLAAQRAQIATSAEISLVSCGTRFVGPAGEVLYEVARSGEQMERSYRELDLHRLLGVTHHGAVMFRGDSYRAAGGYREPFQVAQDLDLWLRLSERGRLAGLQEVLYVARLDPTSISGMRRPEQIRAARVALACAQRRRSGADDTPLLDSPFLQRRPTGRVGRAWRAAQSRYFIGACLASTQPSAARRYYRQAIRAFPLHLRSWVALGSLRMVR